MKTNINTSNTTYDDVDKIFSERNAPGDDIYGLQKITTENKTLQKKKEPMEDSGSRIRLSTLTQMEKATFEDFLSIAANTNTKDQNFLNKVLESFDELKLGEQDFETMDEFEDFSTTSMS